MSINLLDLAKGYLGNAVMSKASQFLGESEANTQKGMDHILPSLLGGLMSKGSTQSGLNSIMGMLDSQDANGGILNDVAGLFSGGENSNSIMNMGSGIVSSLLGNKAGGIIDMITSASGMKRSSSSNLLSMAAPILMGILGKQRRQGGLDASGLASLLMGQKDHLKAAAPAGLSSLLGLGNLDQLGNGLKNTVNSVGETGERVLEGATAATQSGGSALRRVLPLLLVGLIAILGWGYFQGWFNSAKEAVVDGVEVVENAAEATGDAVTTAAETVGDFAENVIEKVSFSLPSGESIDLVPDSFEDKFAKWLSGEGKEVNQRFTFDRLRFETGSATLMESSQDQLQTLARLMAAYSDVNIRLEGYTDNTGDPTANMTLSKLRADSVKEQLVALGVDATRIETDGLGIDNPVASNETEEGRAQNRRIEVVVTKY